MNVAAEAGKWMGRGMALLVDTLNPQIIVLGSLAVALGHRILEPARRALAEEALPQAVAACEVIPAKLGKSIGDVAALMAALSDDAIRARLGIEHGSLPDHKNTKEEHKSHKANRRGKSEEYL